MGKLLNTALSDGPVVHLFNTVVMIHSEPTFIGVEAEPQLEDLLVFNEETSKHFPLCTENSAMNARRNSTSPAASKNIKRLTTKAKLGPVRSVE